MPENFAIPESYRNEPLISLPAEQPITWNQFKYKVGLRDDDPLSVYQDAQATYFKEHIAPRIGDKAEEAFPAFMQQTARPQKYSPMGELFMQGATQAGKTALQAADVFNRWLTASSATVGGWLGQDKEPIFERGRARAEAISELSQRGLEIPQMEAKKRYEREVVPTPLWPALVEPQIGPYNAAPGPAAAAKVFEQLLGPGPTAEEAVHVIGDVVGSAPAFKAIGTIVPRGSSYFVDKIGDVVRVKPSYLAAAGRGAVEVGAYNSMVAEPGQKLSEGVHGAIAGGILGAGSRFAEDVADRAAAPFLNWLKWRTEPRTVRDITPEAAPRIGAGEAEVPTTEAIVPTRPAPRYSKSYGKFVDEMKETLARMKPDEKVQLWQEYENSLGQLRSVPPKSTVIDRALRGKGVTVYFGDGSMQNIPYGSKAEDFDLAAKDILQSGKLATHVEGTTAQLSKFYGAFGKVFEPKEVTVVDARNADEAAEAERRLKALGLDVRAEGKQVIFQPSAARKAAGVDVTTPLPPMPEVQLPAEPTAEPLRLPLSEEQISKTISRFDELTEAEVRQALTTSQADAEQQFRKWAEEVDKALAANATVGSREFQRPQQMASLYNWRSQISDPTWPAVERRKEPRLVSSSETVESALGVPVQEALEKGFVKSVEGGWEFTRAGWEHSTRPAVEERVTPEQATEAAHLGTSLVEPQVRMEEIQLTPEEHAASQEMLVSKVPEPPPLERAAGTFTEQEMPVEPQLPAGPKPGIVRHYETIKSQYDQGLIPKSQTAAVQATLRQLEQAIRTGLPDWAPILEPEQPKPLPKVFGVTPEETRAFSQNITVEGYNLTEQQKAQLAAQQTTRESQLRGLGAYGTAGAAERRELIEGAKELLNPNQQLMLEMTEGGVRVHSAKEEVMPELMATPQEAADKELAAKIQQGWQTGKQKAVHLPTGQTIVYTTEATLPKGIEGAHESMFGGALEKTVVSKEAKSPQETQLHEIGHILHSQMPELQKSVHNAMEDVSPGSFGDALLKEGPTGDPLRATWQHMTHNLMAANPVYTDPKIINEEMLVRLFSAIKRTHTEAGRYELMELIKLDDDLEHILDLARTAGNWAFEQMQKGTSKLDWMGPNARVQTYFDKWGMSYLSGVKARTDPSWTLQRYGELLFGSPLIRVGPDGRWMSVDTDGNFQVYDTFRDLMLDGDKGFDSTVSYPELTAALEKELKMHGWEQKDTLPEGPTTQPTSGIIGPSFMARGGLTRRQFLKGKKEPVDVGLTPVTAYFRNSRDWFNSVEEQTKLPVFSTIYLPLDSGQLQLEKFLGTEYPRLYEMLGSTSKEKRFAYRAWLMAKGADAKAEVSHKNNFSEEDLRNVAELRGTYTRLFDTFNIGDSAPFLEDYVPRMEQAEFMKRAGNAAKAAEADPFRSNTALPKEIDYFAKHERVRDEFAEASTEQDAVLQLMQYTRIGAREKFLGPSWEVAKDTWRQLPQALKEPVGKYMQHMYGAPDFTYQALSDWVDKWISKLPGAEKFGFEKDALRKFVLLQYSSSLGFRPALVVRDAMQAFLTAYPHLGARWFGHGFNKALTKEGWELANKYGATIPDNVAPVPEAGEAVDIPGLLQRSLYFTHVGNNFGRVVTFNGTYDRSKLAVAQYRKDKNLDNFLQDSGAEILQQGLARDVFLKASDPSIPIEDVAGLIGRYIAEATQWPVRKGNAPQAIRSQLGRTLGMYGQWPEQFIEYMQRGFFNGSYTHRAAWGTRWLAVNKIAQEFFGTLGADVSRWIWTSPAEYEGSVWTQAFQDLMRAGGQGFESGIARNRLAQLPLQFVPGYQQMRHLYGALDSPNPLLELLGFRVKKETKFAAEAVPPVPGEGGFHSRLGTFLQNLPEKVSSQGLTSVLQSGVTTKNELEATGILNWLKAQPKQVQKKDVLDFFKENQISFKEILKTQEGTGLDEERISRLTVELDQLHAAIGAQIPGGDEHVDDIIYGDDREVRENLQAENLSPEVVDRVVSMAQNYHRVNNELIEAQETNQGGTRYGGGSLTLPGAEPGSYKELLMQLQKPQPPFEYQSSHWQEPNVLLHVRFGDVNREGDKTLRIEEIQSDWLQKGREQGFSNTQNSQEVYDALARTGNYLPPNAPYKETSDWLTLAARKMLRYAVENGYKRISWTTAAQQSQRYGRLVEQIKVLGPNTPRRDVLRITTGPNNDFDISRSQLLEMVGNNQELADTIWNTPTGETVKLDKPLYMEGMEAAYDQMLPNIFRKLLGVKPEKKDAEELSKKEFLHINELGHGEYKPKQTNLELRKMWEVKIPEKVEEKVREEGVPIASNVQAQAEERIA